MRTASVLLLVALLITPAGATDYYVAPNGSNSNPGTLNQPFVTIGQAAAMAQAGDNVYVRGGTYRETVTIARSGTASAPITFQPYAGELVTITGLDSLSASWSPSGGSAYQATVAGGVSQLFVNGRVMTEARWPNNGYNNPLRAGFSKIESATIQQSPALSTITDSKLGNPSSGYWNGAKMAMAAGSEWVITGPTNVLSQSGNNLNFQTDLAPPAYTPTAGNPYFLYGTRAALDAPKEWHYDSSTSQLYLQAPGGADPASHNVEIRKRELGLDLGSQSHVNVNGFRFVAAGINVAGDHNTLDNNQILYPTAFTTGSGFHPPGGVEITGSHNTITRSEIAYTWGSGVMVKGSHNTIDDNLIHDVNWSGQQGGFIKIDDEHVTAGGNDNSITNNTMYNAGRDGINLVNSAANTQILHNNIGRFGYLVRDLGGIYTISTDAEGSVIAYNRISDNRSSSLNVGIYFDYDTSGITAHHNLVTNAQLGVIVNSPGADINVYNNTLWNVQQVMSTFGDAGTGISNVKVYNNLSNDNQWSGNDVRNNRYQTADQFTNAAAGDYTLTANNGLFFQTGPTFRKAVDSGRVIAGITDGYTGSAPDAGAFERGLAAWSSGASWDTWLASRQQSAPLATALQVTSANARAKNTSLQVGENQRGFLKFDLSSLSEDPIVGAVLRIYENAAQDLGVAGNLTLSRVTSAWTDANVSYGQSKIDLSSAFYDPANVDFYTDIDVTDTVFAWLSDPSTNFGFSLQGTGPLKSFDGFFGLAAPTLLLTHATPGDTDLDGDVDVSDLANLASSYGINGPSTGWINGDFDHDDDVDLNDLGRLARHYGQGPAQAIADFQALVVPEPSAASLVGILLVSLPVYFGRTRSSAFRHVRV